MKNYDRWSSLFLLGLSIAVCLGSLQLRIGKLSNPGMGFMAFGTSILLGLLSLSLFFLSIFRKKDGQPSAVFGGQAKVILVLVALVIYAQLMPVVGYLITTFLMMGIFFWIVRKYRWWWVLISALLATVTSYLVFSVWLNSQFPAGIFGF